MHVRALPPTRLARAALIAAWVGAALIGARVCVAAPCPVEIRGEPSEAWLRAGRAIEGLTTDLSDCARIELELEPSSDTARLTFVTLDGRRAERRLAHPDELMPTVVALGIGGASETSTPVPEAVPLAAPPTPVRATDAAPPAHSLPAQSPPSDSLPAQSPPSHSEPVDSPPSPSQPAATPEEARALFAVLAGARGGAGRLVSPVLEGAVAIAPGRWELGLNLALELQYFDLQLPDPDGPSSAASLGVTVGRREPLADVELLYGVRGMVAALNDESQKDSGVRGGAEIRVGAYLGGVWPRQWSSRFRGGLVLDVVPHDSLGDIGKPVTPWLALSALIGVEFGGA